MGKLIESLIKPTKKDTRTVTVFGVDYVFQQVKKGHYVALVEDQAAIDCLLANKAFREFTESLTPKVATPSLNIGAPLGDSGAAPVITAEKITSAPLPPPVEKPAAPAAVKEAAKEPAPKPKKAPGKTETDASSTADEVTAKAQALLHSTPIAIKKQLDKSTPSVEVLEKAIAIETAESNPRQIVLGALTGALSNAKAALEG